MRKRFKILCLLILFTTHLLSNNVTVYLCDVDEAKSNQCKLYLSEDKSYKLEVSVQRTPDIINIIVWSVGKYRINTGVIELMDQNGFTMTVARRKGDIRFLKGYNWLIGRKFQLIDEITQNAEDFNFKGVDNEVLSKKIEMYKNEVLLHNLKFTKYRSGILDFFINENKNYTIKTSGGIVLSQGIWNRMGNLLMIHDNSVNQKYYLYIERNNLCILKLLGENRGVFSLQ